MSHTMTTGEASIMAALRDHDRLTSRELQVCANVSETGARVCAATLEKRGLIERRRSAWVLTADGRRFATTKRGQAVLDVPVGARG